jgi:hypothetical protein
VKEEREERKKRKKKGKRFTNLPFLNSIKGGDGRPFGGIQLLEIVGAIPLFGYLCGGVSFGVVVIISR